MNRIITNTNSSNSHNIDFKANKKSYTAPDIAESYVGDNGEVMHVLKNGNEQSDISYVAMWGKPKGIVNNDKKYKGENPCKKNHWLK